jgi:capsid protein
MDVMFTPMDFRTTLSASRSVVANNGAIKGAIIQKADASVGRAWEPEFQGEDQEWAKLAKDWLRSWYATCDVRGSLYDFKQDLWLDSYAIDGDGGVFVLLTQTAAGYPQIQHIPAHRIGSRGSSWRGVQIVQEGKYKGLTMRNGVIESGAGAPVAYNFLADNPADDQQIDAQNIIPIADPEWHNQSRGIPSLSHGINEIRKADKSKNAELMAMMMMGSYAILETNETGMVDTDAPNSLVTEDSSGQNIVIQSFEEGMVKHMKAGAGEKLESIDNSRPGDPWESFQDRVIREVIGPVWPYELSWKKSDLNGTTTRIVQAGARMKVEKRQDVLRGPAIRMVGWAIAKAIKIGQLPPSDDWFRWDFTMPPKVSIDPGRDSKAMIEEYKLGFINKTDIHQEKGKTYEDVIRRRAVEIVTAKKIVKEVEQTSGETIDPREMQMLTANEMAEDTEQPTTQGNE